MKTTNLNTDTIEAMFKQLRLSFGGSITKKYNEYILEIENEIGKGEIQGVSLSDGISYIEFDMTFFENIMLSIKKTDKKPIYFTYCSKGSLEHSFGIEGKKNTLKSFQTGILTSPLNDENILYLKKDESIKLTIISVHNEEIKSKNNRLKNKLNKTFFKEDALENFIYIGSQNLKIAEKIHQINTIKEVGIVRSLLINGLVHVILALEIQQHGNDAIHRDNQLGSLLSREIEIIKQVTIFIKNKFDTQISITQLCSEFGISPSKLQEGFKLMHGCTVIHYIRELRIQKAEEFIKETDMNISEVVYSIGFTSRSYFSKIFREKYNCSPSKYMSAQKTALISA
ncbi:AraC-type DNA-binding protein [Flaviramulus basaltis]|uniref:AraC-type DNA-binding protein n=1 Tax=Flaviramulus basaltis TaxID=369401 RepID=A0A1K2IIU9_9FLAO|nr:AraC family transcriptional regulator [Flaviramulus basaltis]SFZ92353.1 AraC-type DNA-binding protein [Flaviramulus basaltis]